MASRLWIIVLLTLCVPSVIAHTNGEHVAFEIPDFEETGEVFPIGFAVANASARIISASFSQGDSLMLGGSETSEYAVALYAGQELLLEAPLNVELTFHGETVNETGDMSGYIFNRTEVEFFMRVPAIKGATKFVVLKGRQELLTVDLMQFCRVTMPCAGWKNEQNCPLQCGNQSIIPATQCGNSVCDNSETYRTCPADCKSGGADKLCDRVKDDICDPDCSPGLDADCAAAPIVDTPSKEDNSKTPVWIWLALFGVAMLLILGVVMFLNRRQPPARPPQQDFGKYQQQYQQYQQQKNYRR